MEPPAHVYRTGTEHFTIVEADFRPRSPEETMANYLVLAPAPTEEDCVCVGEEDYMPRARAECQRFIALLRKKFGPEPAGAHLAVQSFLHDFGNYLALLTVLKKWTFDLSMTKVALRRQIFEANVNWFTLILQVHGTKPLDDPVQQASVRLG